MTPEHQSTEAAGEGGREGGGMGEGGERDGKGRVERGRKCL